MPPKVNRAFSAGTLFFDKTVGRCPRLAIECCAFGAKTKAQTLIISDEKKQRGRVIKPARVS
jgi:hypothetical protein